MKFILGILEEGVTAGEIPREAVARSSVIAFRGLIQIYLMRCSIGFEDVLDAKLAERVVYLFLNGIRKSL